MYGKGSVDVTVEVRLHADRLSDAPRVIHLPIEQVLPRLFIEDEATGLVARYVRTQVSAFSADYLFEYLD